MERRKSQNREAQRRYRENIKRKIKLAEREFESRGASAAEPRVSAGKYGYETNMSCNVPEGLHNLDCSSPTLDFGWMSLNPPTDIHSKFRLASPPEGNAKCSSTLAGSGSTAMHIAAQKGHHKIVRILAESGVDVAARDDIGQTPLHLAAANGHIETIIALVDVGAEVDVRNFQGQTPLFAAVERGEDVSVKLLLENGADPNARIWAIPCEITSPIVNGGGAGRSSTLQEYI